MPRNVAMAAILKHAAVSSPGEEGEKKTVMFVTPRWEGGVASWFSINTLKRNRT